MHNYPMATECLCRCHRAARLESAPVLTHGHPLTRAGAAGVSFCPTVHTPTYTYTHGTYTHGTHTHTAHTRQPRLPCMHAHTRRSTHYPGPGPPAAQRGVPVAAGKRVGGVEEGVSTKGKATCRSAGNQKRRWCQSSPQVRQTPAMTRARRRSDKHPQ